MWRRPFFYLSFLCLMAAGGIALGFGIRIQILEIGEKGPSFLVKEGDQLSLQYIQSMYGVLVEEKLRVERKRLVLYEVASSDAALEYLGLERRGKDNVHRVLQGFTIPRASVGKHVLVLKNHTIHLADLKEPTRAVHIRLTDLFLWQYLINELERRI